MSGIREPTDAGPGAEAGAGFRDYKNSFGSVCVAASVRPGSGRVHEHTTLWALALRPVIVRYGPREDEPCVVQVMYKKGMGCGGDHPLFSKRDVHWSYLVRHAGVTECTS